MNRIFVAIASYRDPECQWTLKDLFESATHPQRILVGICWQFDPESDQSCFTLPNPRPEQTRVIKVGLNETRGACWAKSQALSLRNGEEYVLLIDSHMRFAPGWDVEMIDMLTSIDNPQAFLSTYPAGYEPPNQRRFSTPRLAPVKFFERIMSQNSVLLEMPRPMESSLVAGGYLFGFAEMFDQVPYDPHIYFIGEEITHAARYYTHGWDGYTPHKCLIHHYYSRKTATKHWQDEKESWSRLNRISYQRVRHILQIERSADPEVLAEIKRYDLGSKRTLASFQAAIGVNFSALLIDRTRHESVSCIEAAFAAPSPPPCAPRDGQSLRVGLSPRTVALSKAGRLHREITADIWRVDRGYHPSVRADVLAWTNYPGSRCWLGYAYCWPGALARRWRKGVCHRAIAAPRRPVARQLRTQRAGQREQRLSPTQTILLMPKKPENFCVVPATGCGRIPAHFLRRRTFSANRKMCLAIWPVNAS